MKNIAILVLGLVVGVVLRDLALTDYEFPEGKLHLECKKDGVVTHSQTVENQSIVLWPTPDKGVGLFSECRVKNVTNSH